MTIKELRALTSLSSKIQNLFITLEILAKQQNNNELLTDVNRVSDELSDYITTVKIMPTYDE